MPERASYWTSRLGLALLLALPASAPAQDGLAGVCSGLQVGLDECHLAIGTARIIQPRIGIALWGGSPVPGTASTLGLRRPRSPRLGLSARIGMVPTTLPPLLDRSRSESETALVTAVSVQTTVGLFHGYSPLATAGGVASLDLVGRLSYGRLPTGKGFDHPSVWGLAVGLRLGVLRESLTLPGVSVTATYGRSGMVSFGDPDGVATDGAIRGAVSGLHATAAVSRRVFGLRLGSGLSFDRYSSDVQVRYSPGSLQPQASARGDATLHRWSAFGSVTWTRLIYHAILELGVQESPAPGGLPADVALDPAGWWVAAAFRFTP